MKRLVKLDECSLDVDFSVAEEAFGAPVTVQGGKKRASGNKLLIESGGRYKLYSDTADYIKFLAGSGHFKWARGETPFACGDVFLAEGLGEYEINGHCTFTVVRI